MLASIAFNYWMAIGAERAQSVSPARARTIVGVAVAVN